MENLAQLAPLIILIPALGATINFFFGMRMGDRAAAIVGSTASGLTFVIAVLLLSYLTGNDYQPAVINPPFLESWIRMDSIGLDITWQQRVDTLSVSMLLFVTFVGTLIHIYASGYMQGDPRFPRFFAYLNMFLTFMLILITGNNFLMMFVGWEGVGLCSYLLIGFWWDKPNGVGWKNGNAARKAFILNRVGDFGVLTAIFLIFWTFGTLDFYKPGEINNVAVGAGHHAEEEHAEEGAAVTEGEHSEEATTDHSEEAAVEDEHAETTTDEHGEEAAAEDEHEEAAVASTEGEHGEEDEHGEGTAAEGEHGEEAVHGEEHGTTIAATISWETEGVELHQLGVFGQTNYLLHQEDETGEAYKVNVGPFELSLETTLVLITLFLLLGATGKSAQIPLFVWLPDAMAGPTPVSALIHAATMVTSGVYMMVRANVFFSNAELTSFIVTLVGATTAIVAGFIAMGQFDIKRVLAYSTVSQLGFMVAAVGLGAYPAAMFHMITHAFFKALLFLGSGSVIHGMEHGHHHAHEHGHGHDNHGDHHDDHHHEEEFDPQDMRNMGGLSKKMPLTYWTYLLATLALAGIWPFAGFWSKDEILADAWQVGFEDGLLKGYLALGILILAAGFTAFYMWRQIEMVFHGKPRTEAAEHAPESAWSMVIPLIILGFFSVVIGFINIPSGIGSLFVFGLDGSVGRHVLGDFLEHSIANFHLPPFQPLIALTALTLGLGAIFTARSIYGGDKSVIVKGHDVAHGRDPLEVSPSTGSVWRLANARMYWDQIYFTLIENPFNRLSVFLADVVDWNFLHDYFHDTVIYRGFNTIGKLLSTPFDLGIIDGAVNGIGWLVNRVSGIMRQSQTGYVRTYTLALFLGVVLVIVVMLLPLLKLG